MIDLVNITPSNKEECIALTVFPDQKGFVATNADSLEEAQANPGMCPMGIRKDGVLVGFAMCGYDSEEKKSWIIRFMIDAAHQRKGYGREALTKLIRMLLEKHEDADIRLCVEPENEVAIKLYEGFGFLPTGEKWGDELIFEFISQPPLPSVRRKPLYGCSKDKIWIADDFDAPLDDFKEYM